MVVNQQPFPRVVPQTRHAGTVLLKLRCLDSLCFVLVSALDCKSNLFVSRAGLYFNRNARWDPTPLQ
jgi:hypothetical protein